MKNLRITIVLLIITLLCSNIAGQEYKKEFKTDIESNYQNLLRLIDSNDYGNALQLLKNIEYSVQILHGLYLDEQLCPLILGDYKLNPDTRSNEMIGNNITIIREYMLTNSDNSFNEDQKVELIISNNDDIINKIAFENAFAFNLIDEMERKYLPTEIKGNKALLVFDKNKKFTSLAIALTENTTVRITITGNIDSNFAYVLADLINLEKIKIFLP
ncbi:MAG: hypothetical protein IPM71_10215 [Bacteroidota bacterium]|nr:MAG: hypothetical protein IPM71_10215 [Bacteroidota bacterium]